MNRTGRPSARPSIGRPRVNAWVLKQLARAAPSEQSRLLFVTLLAGGVCGLVAVSFHLVIRLSEHLAIHSAYGVEGRGWIAYALAVPVLGGLVAGTVVLWFPAARGSGIPQVKAAYTLGRSRDLRLRDAVVKFLLASVQIGTGASLGREGPTVQICSAVAGALGRVFALSPSNLRRLIPVGAAAGVAAAFNSPIAAVTFVIEELVGALDTTILSGVVVAAAIAAVVERSVLGEHPIFNVPSNYGLNHPSSLLVFAAMGLVAGLSGSGFVSGLLGLRARFARSSIPPQLRPAIGALATALIAAIVFGTFGLTGVAGGGYATVEQALRGALPLEILLALCVAKALATIFSYSSGGVGGIFAPTLFVGSMLGGMFGYLDGWLLGHDANLVGTFALVGMGAFFAAVVRAPMTSVLIIFEMTGSYGLILPLMIANMIAYVVSRRSRRLPIYEALLEQDGVRLPHEPTAMASLSSLSVATAMTRDVVVLSPDMTVADALDRIATTDFTSLPVRDEHGTLLGVLTEARLRRLASEVSPDVHLREQVRVREFLHSGQSLRDALSMMSRLGIRQVAVVEEANRTKLAGILSMSDVMRRVLSAEGSPDPVAETPLPS